MSVLTITAKGQVTSRKEFLRHLGVRPGAKVSVENLGAKAFVSFDRNAVRLLVAQGLDARPLAN